MRAAARAAKRRKRRCRWTFRRSSSPSWPFSSPGSCARSWAPAGPTQPPIDRASARRRERAAARRQRHSAQRRADGRADRRRRAPDRWKGFAAPGSPVAAGFDAIAAVDPSFAPDSFLSGARTAYEMIVGAFAAGDLSTLRRLLAPEVLANFDKAIRDRVAAEQTMTTTLVSIDAAELVEARLAGTRRLGRRALRRQAGVGDARQVGRRGRRLAQRRRRPSRRLDVHARRRRARPQLAVGGDADRALSGRRAPWRRSRSGARRDAEAASPRFDALAGFADDDALAAFAAFRDWARAASRATRRRCARRSRRRRRLMRVAAGACGATIADDGGARRFFVDNFRPWRVVSGSATAPLSHRLLRTRGRRLADADAGLSRSHPRAAAPISSASRRATARAGFDPRLAGAAAARDGSLVPYPDRAAIEAKGGEAGRLARRPGRSLLRPGAGLGAR